MPDMESHNRINFLGGYPDPYTPLQQKTEIKYYLLIKYVSFVALQQIPFAVVHLVEALTNHSVCLGRHFTRFLTYR